MEKVNFLDSKYCFNCGAEIPANAIFCLRCGKKQIIEIRYCGFWRRFSAWVVDKIIIFAFISILVILVSFVPYIILWEFFGIDITPELDFWIAVLIITIIFDWLYHAIFESSKLKATPGKLLMRMAVLDKNLKRISFNKANIRYWGKLLSSLFLFIGFIEISFTEKKQGLHDFIAGTLVVRRF